MRLDYMVKDIYATRELLPMTIGGEPGGLAEPNYLYELKFDGFRCLAYLDPKAALTDIRSKGNRGLLARFPELAGLYSHVQRRCVLDGELVILTKGGCPDFEALQARRHMSGTYAIQAEAKRAPATLIVFDILYEEDEPLTGLPLLERKARLAGILDTSEQGTIRIRRPHSGLYTFFPVGGRDNEPAV